MDHVFARMKAWKILRDCRQRGNGVAVAMVGVARLVNLAHAALHFDPLRSYTVSQDLRDSVTTSYMVTEEAHSGRVGARSRRPCPDRKAYRAH